MNVQTSRTMPPDLVTNRFQLTLLGPVHLVEVHELFSDPHGHTIGDGPSQTSSQTLEWLERRQSRYRDQGLAWYGIWDDGSFVGSCGAFTGQRCGDDPEIGYETKRALRGHGIALEAAEAVTAAVLDAGHRRLWATIRPHNTASCRIVEQLGYALERDEPDAKGALLYYSRD